MSMSKVKVIFNDDGSDKYLFDGKEIKLDSVSGTAGEVVSALSSGGFSTECIPLKSSQRGKIDEFISRVASDDAIVFNLCEGAFGKSSFEMHIAALLDLYGVKYTGSGPLTLGLSLDKGLTKDILHSRDIPTPEYCVMNEPPLRLKRGLKFPLIVKPLKEDASLGIDSGAVVKTMKELKKRVEYIIAKFIQPAIVEEYVEGREFNIAVIGNNGSLRALPPSEIEFIDFPEGIPKICCYEAKWVTESPLYKKTVPSCPANVPESLRTSSRPWP